MDLINVYSKKYANRLGGRCIELRGNSLYVCNLIRRETDSYPLVSFLLFYFHFNRLR